MFRDRVVTLVATCSRDFGTAKKPAPKGRSALSNAVSLMAQLQVGYEAGHVVFI